MRGWMLEFKWDTDSGAFEKENNCGMNFILLFTIAIATDDGLIFPSNQTARTWSTVWVNMRWF